MASGDEGQARLPSGEREASRPPTDMPSMSGQVRDFGTGATRSIDTHKPDYHGYDSPLVAQRYAQYMLKHQQTPAGRRESYNWQLGMPRESYIIGGTRHWQDVRLMWDGFAPDHDEPGYDMEEALCAMIFNAKGLLFELLLERYGSARPRLTRA